MCDFNFVYKHQTLSLEDDNVFAPKIVKKLPKIIQSHLGDKTILEVKVIGKPKPKTKWLKEGQEILPSEEYQIEELTDGTSILTITSTYPEDTGTITFEAHNPLGVAESITEITTEGSLFLLLNCLLKLAYFNIFFISYKV